jgi:hypothetical protein
MARSARVDLAVALDPDAALALWADAGRWSSFVEGFQRIEELSPEWPAAGARIVWHSGPEGRGRVTEKIVEHGGGVFITDVAEERLRGRQTAAFEERPKGGTVATLILDYELTSDSPFIALANLIFIRPALRSALDRTLRRFAVEAAEGAALPDSGV